MSINKKAPKARKKRIRDMTIGERVQKSAKEKGIGITALCKHCDLRWEVIERVWNDKDNSKLWHVEQILDSLGLELKVVKKKGDEK
jgi:predicted transcriptional regulator